MIEDKSELRAIIVPGFHAVSANHSVVNASWFTFSSCLILPFAVRSVLDSTSVNLHFIACFLKGHPKSLKRYMSDRRTAGTW